MAGLFLFFRWIGVRIFWVANAWIFGKKRVFAGGVLWVADRKMCGKRGLREALFSG
jgi:hypothetical protein